MVRQLLTRTSVGRLATRLPIFRLLAVAQIALLAREHLRQLSPEDRLRLRQLVRRGRSLDGEERRELRALAARLEARAFVMASADKLSPVPLPRRLTRRQSAALRRTDA